LGGLFDHQLRDFFLCVHEFVPLRRA
jgi:hypothetical protein